MRRLTRSMTSTANVTMGGVKSKYFGTASSTKLLKQEVKVEERKVKVEPSLAAIGSEHSTKMMTPMVKVEKKRKRKATTSPKSNSRKPKVAFTPPSDWREKWAILVHLREGRDAPVDSMGCSELYQKDIPDYVKHYQNLISLMLSSQTKDQVNAAAMEKLFQHGLTVDNILSTPDETLKSMISKVSFFNRKTIYIKKATQILKDKYDGKVPSNIKDITSLPGVGPKMGYLLLSCAFGIHNGIGVDTHVHRISNQLRWAKSSTPEETRLQLESWLPQEYFFEVNTLMVGIGQMIQQPKERSKLIARCIAYPTESEQKVALKLIAKFGMKVEAEAEKANIPIPNLK